MRLRDRAYFRQLVGSRQSHALITVAALADSAEVSEGLIYQLLCGARTDISKGAAARIAHALGCRMAVLFVPSASSATQSPTIRQKVSA